MTTVQLGRKCKLYISINGNFGGPSWLEVANVSDLTRSIAWDTTDANSRESAAKMIVKTLVDLSISGKLKFANGDANTNSIMDALMSPDAFLDVLCLSGPLATAGNYGVRFQAQVTEGNEDQGLGTALYEDIKFMPTPLGGNAPQSAKVVGSAPVFTSI